MDCAVPLSPSAAVFLFFRQSYLVTDSPSLRLVAPVIFFPPYFRSRKKTFISLLNRGFSFFPLRQQIPYCSPLKCNVCPLGWCLPILRRFPPALRFLKGPPLQEVPSIFSDHGFNSARGSLAGGGGHSMGRGGPPSDPLMYAAKLGDRTGL